MAAKCRKPSHVVVVADEREKYILEVSIPGVSYLIKPGLNFESTLKYIKESSYYGKGTVFINFSGLFSLIKCLNFTCNEEKCLSPPIILQETSQKRNLIEKAELLKENFYMKNSTDELIFCEVLPISNKNFATWHRGKFQNACASNGLQLHDINLEIDCFNNWARDTANDHYPKIKTFHLHLNSREIESCNTGLSESGLVPPAIIQEKRKKLIHNLSHYFLVDFKPPVISQKMLKPKTKSPCDSKMFDNVVLVANIAYKQVLDHLKSPKVMIVANEDLNSENISTYVSHYSHLSDGKNTLWIFVSGIFSVVQPYFNSECSFCSVPILKVLPLQSFRSEKQKSNFINNILLVASNIEKSIKKVLHNKGSVIFSPLIPGQLMNLTNLKHEEQHFLHERYTGLVCVEGKDLITIKALYNALCLQWLGFSALNLQHQGISDDDIVNYLSLTQGKHVEAYISVSQGPSPLLKRWISFMQLFINKILKNNLNFCLYKDLDDPSTSESKQYSGKDLHRKFNHIVFIGPKSLCQTLEAKLTIGTSFIEEDLNLLDLRKVSHVSKSLTMYPKNSLFIVLFDENLIADKMTDDSYPNGNSTASFLVPRNQKNFSERFLSDSDLVKEAVASAQMTINILKKKVPTDSSVIVSPISPLIGMWIDPTRKNPRILQFIQKKKPDASFLHGTHSQWIKIAGILKIRWKQFLVAVFKQEKLNAQIPLSYINKHKYIINVVQRPTILIEMKENPKEIWMQCLGEMYSYFLNMDFLLSLPEECPSNDRLQGESANYENSVNDLRETINQARRKRKMQEVSQVGQRNDCETGKGLEDLVITINREGSASSDNIGMTAKVEVNGLQKKVEDNRMKTLKLPIDEEPLPPSGRLADPSAECHAICINNSSDLLIQDKKMKQKPVHLISDFKTEAVGYEGDFCLSRNILNDIIPCYSELCHTVKQEPSESNEVEKLPNLLIAKGQFNNTKPLPALDLMHTTSEFHLSLLDASVFSLEHPTLANFFFTAMKSCSLEIRHSFLPSKLSCVLGYGIRNLTTNLSDTFQGLFNFSNKRLVSQWSWKSMRIICSRQEVFTERLLPAGSSIKVIMKSSTNKSKGKNKESDEVSRNVRINLVDVENESTLKGSSTKITPVSTGTKRKLSKDSEEDPSIVPLKRKTTQSNVFSEIDGQHRCLILCKNAEGAMLPSDQENLKLTASANRHHSVFSLNKSPLVPSNFTQGQTLALDQTSYIDATSPNVIASVTNYKKIHNWPSNGSVVTKQEQRPGSVASIARWDKKQLENECIIKLRVSGISSTLSAKFIKDLSIACGCDKEPRKDTDGYILEFREELTPAIFIKTFHGRRLYDMRLKVKISEGSISERNLRHENAELSKCLIHLLEIHQTYLATVLQTKYLQDIDICTYKVQKCPKIYCQQKKTCVNYHSEEDRRRVVKDCEGQYIPTLCKNVHEGSNNHCSWGDECRLAHNEAEQTFHPLRYKKEVCPISSVRGILCSRTNFCSFVHSGAPDSLYHDGWKDVFITGLEQSLDYLVGAVRMMRRVIFKLGITALFVTPSADFLSFALNIVLPIAEINDVCILALTEEMNRAAIDLTSVHLLAGTPKAVRSVLSQNSSHCYANLRVLIIDDISYLLKSSSLSLITTTVLEAIKSRRKSSHALNQVVIGDRVDEELLLASSKMLQTKLITIKTRQQETKTLADHPPAATSTSAKPRDKDSEGTGSPKVKRIKRDFKTSVLKDKSNIVSRLPTSKPAPDNAKIGSSGGQEPVIDGESIDEMLSRSELEAAYVQSREARSKLSRKEEDAFASFEKALEREQHRSIKDILKHPNNDPDFERKFSIFASKYQTHYGITRKTKHFQELWRRFWKQHVTERMERELVEKKRKFIEVLHEYNSDARNVESSSVNGSTKDPFSPVFYSSPKPCGHFSSVTVTLEAAKPAGSPSPVSSSKTLSPRTSGRHDTSFSSYPVTNYKKLFEQSNADEVLIRSPFDLSQISEESQISGEEYFSKDAFSSISDNTLFPSPVPSSSRNVTPSTGKVGCRDYSSSHDRSPRSGSIGRDGEAKVEKAVLSLGGAITQFAHLTTGFYHVVASFDNGVSVMENVKKALREEDNVILFLLIKDSLDYVLETSKDSALIMKYENGLEYCREILSLVPEN